MERQRLTVTVVGGGASAHVLIPFLSGGGHRVQLLTRRPDEWASTVHLELQSIDGELEREFEGALSRISSDPAEVIPNADAVILCMPVCKYRSALHALGPHLARDREVSVGTIYGQAGFNWMVGEIERELGLDSVTTFAVGLIPWICRVLDYGRRGVTYGCKEVNVAAVSPRHRFAALERDLLRPTICERWFGKARRLRAGRQLPVAHALGGQPDHPPFARCYGLFQRYGGRWRSAGGYSVLLPRLRRAVGRRAARRSTPTTRRCARASGERFPDREFTHMLDYLALERFSYRSAEHRHPGVVHHLADPGGDQAPDPTRLLTVGGRSTPTTDSSRTTSLTASASPSGWRRSSASRCRPSTRSSSGCRS